MIRLIVSDIDGTLMPEGGNHINPEYMDVIRELTDRGAVFAAASGRQAESVDAVFHELRGRIYYLSDNGASIQTGGKSVRLIRMDKENVIMLLRELRAHDDFHILLSTEKEYCTEDKDEDFLRLIFNEYKGVGECVDDLEKCADQCIKISVYNEGGSKSTYDALHDRWGQRFSVIISGAKWVDIMDFESSKGNAVRWIQRQLGVSEEETAVFGDNYNDIPMMECAGRSYASALSAPEIKAAANYEVASYEEDGVLQVLKQILEEIKNGE